MKLRMNENSLFAILLRKPWWISLVIGVAIGAVGYAVFPTDLRVVASLAGFPFLVIGGVALKRQWGQPSPAQVEALLAQAATMAWPQLEAALQRGFAREGHTVRPGPAGADFLLERGGRRVLVGARRWKAARHGEDALAPLLKAIARGDGDSGAYVALGGLTPQARAAARAGGIEVLEGLALASLLR